MLKILVRVLIGMIVALICIGLCICGYFLIIDIHSNIPKELEQECYIEEIEYMERKVFVLKPSEKINSEKYILYCHGGAYMAEMTKNHWEFLRQIVLDTNCTIIVPDYPLSPKYNYEDVFNMMIPLYKEIIDRIDTNNLVLMGDSAGGGMALAMVELIENEKIEKPDKTILISPWLDTKLENPKIEEVQQKDKILSKEKLILAGIAYAGDSGKDSYLVNPIEGNLNNLKNLYIYTGTNDILNPDVHLLSEKAEKVGSKVTIKEYEGANHIWLIDKNSETNLYEEAYNSLINDIIEK